MKEDSVVEYRNPGIALPVADMLTKVLRNGARELLQQAGKPRWRSCGAASRAKRRARQTTSGAQRLSAGADDPNRHRCGGSESAASARSRYCAT